MIQTALKLRHLLRVVINSQVLNVIAVISRLALQLKRVEREIQQLKNRAETCDGNENTRVCNANTCQSEKVKKLS
jgi:hypothetical protein